MARRYLDGDVFNIAIDRVVRLIEAGHRLVVSFSAGKDSCVVLEITLIAAQMTGYGPVDVVIRDEEILFPGSYEYADRVAQRTDELRFHHLVANQPIINCFDRRNPYWWVFDPTLDPDQWVRKPPSYAITIPELNIEAMVTKERFPPAEGKLLYDVLGLRVSESRGRLFGLHSSGGYTTKPRPNGVAKARPIYDWTDADVWKAISENHWDYNPAYNTLHRLGVPPRLLRIAPPTMNMAGTKILKVAAQAWPQWFDKVEERCPGVRTAAQFGIRSVTPMRHNNESWKQVFERDCLGPGVPDWIVERCVRVRDRVLRAHGRHATTPLPEVKTCWSCNGELGCWKNLAQYMYLGDPFALKAGAMLDPIDPEFFRAGAGRWDGTPVF